MEDFKGLVMLHLDEKGNLIGKETKDVGLFGIDYTKFHDGLYVQYRGTDWVFGNDGSLANTALILEGQSQVFSQSFTKTTSIQETSSIGVTFGPSYVKLAISQAYNKTVADSVTKTVTINQTSPIGKETFYKIYLTYARFDVVKVKNGQAAVSATTYEFLGGRATIVQVDKGQGESIDTNALVIREDKCLLPEVTDSIWQIVDNTPNTGILTTGRDGTKIFDLNKQMIFGTFQYMSPSCTKLNFIFNVRDAGNYLIYVGPIVNIDLSDLNINDRDQITRIEFKKADGVNDNYLIKYLEGGKNYVLSLDTDTSHSGSYALLLQKK